MATKPKKTTAPKKKAPVKKPEIKAPVEDTQENEGCECPEPDEDEIEEDQTDPKIMENVDDDTDDDTGPEIDPETGGEITEIDMKTLINAANELTEMLGFEPALYDDENMDEETLTARIKAAIPHITAEDVFTVPTTNVLLYLGYERPKVPERKPPKESGKKGKVAKPAKPKKEKKAKETTAKSPGSSELLIRAMLANPTADNEAIQKAVLAQGANTALSSVKSARYIFNLFDRLFREFHKID